MLTLNSNILKIGNKWILPVNSGGVVPPEPTVYQVTTSATHGTVTASPTEGISGTEITLSNTPDTHYHFGSYSLTGATLKNANQFDIADSDVSVVGNFIEDTKYLVTCTNDGHGTISASPTSNYSGSTVTLSNTPNSGYQFDKYTLVSGTGASISGDTLTIGTSNVTVRGDFLAQTYNYLLLELTGYDGSSYWYGGQGGYYGVKSFKFNGSSITSFNCKAGYVSQGDVTKAIVDINNIEALAFTGPYTSSPYFWGEQYNSSYASMYRRTYILVGTGGTVITSGTISFQDLLQNTNVPSTGGITITSKLYGVPASAVNNTSYGAIVNIGACTLLNTGTHTAKYAPIYGSTVTLNTTTISYGV